MLHFIASTDAMQYIADLSISKLIKKDIAYTFDLIDMPYWFSYKADKKTLTTKLYRQERVYNKDEEKAVVEGSVVYDREKSQACASSPHEYMGDFLRALDGFCYKLGSLIQTEGWEELYADMNPEESGILLRVKNDELSHELVSGRMRPCLTVDFSFGGTVKARPYLQDIKDYSELEGFGFKWKLAAAERGNVIAMRDVAEVYYSGDADRRIDKDPEQAFYWMKKAAEAGVSDAMYYLGLFYSKGLGVKRNFEEAAKWMNKAANLGDDDATKLADDYVKYAEAERWARTGDAKAQGKLASALMTISTYLGHYGKAKDFEECIMWATSAVEQNDPYAMWVLGLAYENGRGVEWDTATAISYFEKGAELGNAECQHSLGCYYAKGGHFLIDYKKAFELFLKSAEQGYGPAMRDVGRCYHQRTGCEKDLKKARDWYTKAFKLLKDPKIAQALEEVEEEEKLQDDSL